MLLLLWSQDQMLSWLNLKTIQFAQVTDAILLITKMREHHHTQLTTLSQISDLIQKLQPHKKTSMRQNMRLETHTASRVSSLHQDHQLTILSQTSELIKIFLTPLSALMLQRNKKSTNGTGFLKIQNHSLSIKVFHQLKLLLPRINLNWIPMLFQLLIMLMKLNTLQDKDHGTQWLLVKLISNGHDSDGCLCQIFKCNAILFVNF